MRWFQMGHLASKGTEVAIGKPEDTSLYHITTETMTLFPALLEKACPDTQNPGNSFSWQFGERGGGREKGRNEAFLLWSHIINHKGLSLISQHSKEPREVKLYCFQILNLKEGGDKLLFVQH